MRSCWSHLACQTQLYSDLLIPSYSSKYIIFTKLISWAHTFWQIQFNQAIATAVIIIEFIFSCGHSVFSFSIHLSQPGHIQSLVKPDMLDPTLTRLVAVNSIYFKGLWKSRFQAQSTKMRSFTSGDGKSYKVPMMSQLSVFNMGEKD